MPTLGEIATSVLLGDGESAVVMWIPSSEVVISEGTFGLQYSFALLDEQNEPAVLKGGSRLLSAWKKAVKNAPKGTKLLKIRITARGEAGTIKRDWEVSLV